MEAEQNDAFDNSEATDAVVVLVKTTERIYVCHAKLATFSSPLGLTYATNGLYPVCERRVSPHRAEHSVAAPWESPQNGSLLFYYFVALQDLRLHSIFSYKK